MLFDISGGVDEGNPAYISKRKTGEPLFEKFQYAPRTTDWYGRWRAGDGEYNDWGIDRESQRTGVQFTGIPNITMQDQAVTESMGAITDHAHEHLSPSDQMVSRTRRTLLSAARAWRDKGAVPPASRQPNTYLGARAGSFLHDPSVSLEDAYKAQLEKAVRWPVTA
jgi:hypothetical protein